jgi:hypothetical protein
MVFFMRLSHPFKAVEGPSRGVQLHRVAVLLQIFSYVFQMLRCAGPCVFSLAVSARQDASLGRQNPSRLKCAWWPGRIICSALAADSSAATGFVDWACPKLVAMPMFIQMLRPH